MLKPLFDAAAAGEIVVVEQYLQAGAHPEVRDDDGRSVLIHAVHNGHYELVELLATKYKADLKPPDGASISLPIVLAAMAGNTELVKLLLSKGAHPEPTTDDGTTPLAFAAIGGYNDIIQLLLDDERVNPNVRCKVGLTPLMYAIAARRRAAAELLLGRSDPNVRDNRGSTALLHAAESEVDDDVSCDMIKLLLSNDRVDAAAVDLFGHNAVMRAVCRGGVKTVGALLSDDRVHPDVEESFQNRTLAMVLAGSDGRAAMLRLLLKEERVAMTNRDAHGNNVLACAAKEGLDEHVRVILAWFLAEQPVSLDQKNYEGDTALMIACGKRHVGVAKTLLGTGRVNIQERNKRSETALMCAIKDLSKEGEDTHRRAIEIVQLLLGAGSDSLDIADCDNKTLLEFAVESNVPRIVDLLMDSGRVTMNLRAFRKAKGRVRDLLLSRRNSAGSGVN